MVYGACEAVLLCLARGKHSAGLLLSLTDTALVIHYCIQCDLVCRPRAQVIPKDDAGFVQDGRPDIGFEELNPQATEIVTAGSGDSKLFTGW